MTLTNKQKSVLEYIHQLIDTEIPGEWGIKDSYCVLNLTSFGFRVLFEAEWIYWATPQPHLDSDISGVRWVRVTREPQLAKWEVAWRDQPAEEKGTNQARIFLPSLVANKNIAIIAAYQDQQIVAGGIASCTRDVVGLSNIFVPTYQKERFRAGCIAKTIDAFPGLPLVGYETGQDLLEMRALGFEVLGPLRIWVKINRPE